MKTPNTSGLHDLLLGLQAADQGLHLEKVGLLLVDDEDVEHARRQALRLQFLGDLLVPVAAVGNRERHRPGTRRTLM